MPLQFYHTIYFKILNTAKIVFWPEGKCIPLPGYFPGPLGHTRLAADMPEKTLRRKPATAAGDFPAARPKRDMFKKIQ